MTKKKPRRPPRPRTTYEVSADTAEARLDKAVEERTACLMKLDDLNREIPWLERLISAARAPLEPAKAPPVRQQIPPPPAEPRQDQYAPQTFTPPPGAPLEPANLVSQEEFLARFTPRTGQLRTTSPVPPAAPEPPSRAAQQTLGNSEDENEFLSGDGPGVDLLS